MKIKILIIVMIIIILVVLIFPCLRKPRSKAIKFNNEFNKAKTETIKQ